MRTMRIPRSVREGILMPAVSEIILSEQQKGNYPSDTQIAARINERRASGEIHLPRDVSRNDVISARYVGESRKIIPKRPTTRRQQG